MSPWIGVDASKLPGSERHGPLWSLDRAVELGLEGVFFRSVWDLSDTLDAGELAEVSAVARERGLYLEVGTAKCNPFAAPEARRVRELGDGDYLLGFARLIRAAAGAGITELWTATANYQFRIPGMYACDRFRTDVDWSDQLAAATTVLRRIAPVLRDTGTHLNIETHEEISSFETVRLVEDSAPDVIGICFDTANVLVRGEDPVAAARRVAPHVRQTQLRDAALLFSPDDSGRIDRWLAPVGQGVIDWDQLLSVLLDQAPDATWSIEGTVAAAGLSGLALSLWTTDPIWRTAHPDLTDGELDRVRALTHHYEQQAQAGERPDRTALTAPSTEQDAVDFITASAGELRRRLARLQQKEHTVA
ncbi:sugar phosphate isomerase/epimerase family protein [Streptomyces sp. NPDC056190]|uniref:sugar phosphate isomerase/epimerase family protein n=1 Tax=unclassified Streptomyces TaxID=2593676 RepID=UPI0035E2CA36